MHKHWRFVGASLNVNLCNFIDETAGFFLFNNVNLIVNYAIYALIEV
ncbi:hypothetical protein OKT77_01655 [Bacillus anthracis]|nr:hypothetical protein [Bacillus anthracis]MCX9098299.1 hypothetical protein [Bacillus anthracis]